MEIDYQATTIQTLEEEWGWDVDYYRIYGLSWFLKLCLYPMIWGTSKIVESAIESINSRRKEDLGND